MHESARAELAAASAASGALRNTSLGVPSRARARADPPTWWAMSHWAGQFADGAGPGGFSIGSVLRHRLVSTEALTLATFEQASVWARSTKLVTPTPID